MLKEMLKEVDLPCLTDRVKRDLQILALQGMPEEVCGLLHRHGIIHQYQNVFVGDKSHGFDMFVVLDTDTVAIWHSHPGGLIKPSSDDVPVMDMLKSKMISAPWIIVTTHSVTAWTLDL